MRKPSGAVVTGIVRVEKGADPLHAKWDRKPPRLARMDRLCGLALLAAEGALRDAGLTTAACNPERVGVVLGTAFGCHATNEEYYRGVLTDGPTGASPRLFAYTLPSSPLGEVTIHIGSRGPAETLVSGRHAGLEAVGRAMALCGSGRADVVLALAVEVATPTLAKLGVKCVEGAAALLVESAEHAARRGVGARAELVAAASAFSAEGSELAAERVLRLLADQARSPTSRELECGEGDGAVPATAALVFWMQSDPRVGSVIEVAQDPRGGAAGVSLLARARS